MNIVRTSSFLVAGLVFIAASNIALADNGRVHYTRMTSSEYQNIFDALTPHGYRVTWARGYAEGNLALYDFEMRKISGGRWYAYHGMSDDTFRQRSLSLAQQGYQMTVHSAFRVNGQLRHVAIWERP